MLRLIILALGALAIAFIVMVKFLPWWASVLAVLVLMLVTPKLLKYALYRAFKYPFVLKGRALAGATARVHAVCREASKPAAAEADGPAREGYVVDVTITPAGETKSPFGAWELGELILVKPETKDPTSSDEACSVEGIEVLDDGEFVPNEGWKLPGEQRLRLHLRTLPGTTALKFAYYFETFGSIDLTKLAPALPAVLEVGATRPRIAGAWTGTFGYAPGTDKPPVTMTLELEQNGSALAGSTREPDASAAGGAAELVAKIKGRVRTDGSVTFTKAYDGTGGVSHEVEYRGALSPDGTKIEGAWQIGEASGPFALSRARAALTG